MRNHGGLDPLDLEIPKQSYDWLPRRSRKAARAAAGGRV